MSKSPSLRRIQADIRELALDPSDRYYASPLEHDMFEWHFTIRGADGTDFEGGIYHGRILLPPEYPLKPPHIMFLTPSGRFETNTKVCLSFSAYHPELWQPAWGIRLILEALISFLPTPADGAIGALDWSSAERKRLALASQTFTCPTCCNAANGKRTCKDLLPKLKPKNNTDAGDGNGDNTTTTTTNNKPSRFAKEIEALQKLQLENEGKRNKNNNNNNNNDTSQTTPTMQEEGNQNGMKDADENKDTTTTTTTTTKSEETQPTTTMENDSVLNPVSDSDTLGPVETKNVNSNTNEPSSDGTAATTTTTTTNVAFDTTTNNSNNFINDPKDEKSTENDNRHEPPPSPPKQQDQGQVQVQVENNTNINHDPVVMEDIPDMTIQQQQQHNDDAAVAAAAVFGPINNNHNNDPSWMYDPLLNLMMILMAIICYLLIQKYQDLKQDLIHLKELQQQQQQEYYP